MADMKERVAKLKAKFDADPNLEKEISSIKDIDELVAKFHSIGIDFTKEELLSVNQSAKNEGVIEDEQLDAVSGGFCLPALMGLYLYEKYLK